MTRNTSDQSKICICVASIVDADVALVEGIAVYVRPMRTISAGTLGLCVVGPALSRWKRVTKAGLRRLMGIGSISQAGEAFEDENAEFFGAAGVDGGFVDDNIAGFEHRPTVSLAPMSGRRSERLAASMGWGR